jgi:hypothetical protein
MFSMKKLISCLFVIASLASYASSTNSAEALAKRDLEIYEALEKIETEPNRKEALHKQIEKAKMQIEAIREEERRAAEEERRTKEEQDRTREEYKKENPLAFQSFGFSAIGTIAGALVGAAIISKLPPALQHPAVTAGCGGLFVTFAYSAAELLARGSAKKAGVIFEQGLVGILVAAIPVAIFTAP